MDDVSRHNAAVKAKLERGDLVEFDRGAFSHWAVYIGDGKIIHIQGDGERLQSGSHQVFSIGGKVFDKAKVCLDKLDDVIRGSKIYINNSKDKVWEAFSADEIVKIAMSMIGDVGYNIITRNCEHFAKFCRYGIEKSDQVDNMLIGAAVAGTLILTVGLIARAAKERKTE